MPAEFADPHAEPTASETPVDSAPLNEQAESQVEASGDYDMDDGEYADPGESEATETAAADTAEETAVEEVVAETSEEVPVDTGEEFDSTLLAQAEDYGFTADEAKAFGSETALRRALVAMDRKSANFVKAEFAKHTEVEKKPEETKAVEQPEMTAAEQAAFEKLKLEMDPTQFDEDTIKLFNSINDHHDAIARRQHSTIAKLEEKLAALEQGHQQITGRFQAEESARVEGEIDTFIGGLGEEFKEVFGTGPIRQVQDTQALNHRRELFKEMEALMYADQIAGRKPSGVPQLAQRALQMLHGEKFKTIARREVAKKVQQQRKTSVERPTNRKPRHTSPEAAAASLANQWYKDHAADMDEALAEV